MGKVQQITATLAPEERGLARLVEALGDGRIAIRAFQAERGKARMVVDDPERALAALRDAGIEGWLGEALSVAVPPDPKALGDLVERLSAAGVAVEAAYTGPWEGPGRVRMILVVSDLETSMALVADTE
jgi:hypothetical protein